MTEAELDRVVAEECARLGVRRYAVPDSRRVEFRGFPDLVLWGPGGLIFRELKSEQGRLSRDQQRVADSLREAKQNWGVWRPSYWKDGGIPFELEWLRRGR